MTDLSLFFSQTIANENGVFTKPQSPEHLLLVSELISTAFLNNDNTARKKAELQLEALQTSGIVQHLTELFQIIYNLNLQNAALEERVIIYTSALLRKVMNFDKLNDSAIIVRLIGLNTLCLFKEQLPLKNKMKLSVALEYLINLSSHSEVKSQVVMVILDFLSEFLKLNDNPSRTLTKSLIVKVLMHQIFESSPAITQKFFLIFSQTLVLLKTSISAMIAAPGKANETENLEIAIIITDVISILFQKALNDIESRSFLRDFMTNTEFLELFVLIFGLQIDQDRNPMVLVFAESEDLVNAVHNVKYNIVHSANILHRYFMGNEENFQNLVNGQELEFPQYVRFNETLLKSTIMQFSVLYTSEKLLGQYSRIIETKMQSSQQLLNECCLFMIECGKDFYYFRVFTDNDVRFILSNDVILNVLKNDSADYEQAAHNPDEFVALDNDICDLKNSNILRTNMSSLLLILCERIDGTLYYFSKFLLESLDYIIKSNRGDKSAGTTLYKVLPRFQSNHFLLHTEDANIIETILLSFSILSTVLTKRSDLVTDVEDVFKGFLLRLFNSNSGISNLNRSKALTLLIIAIIKSRICLMMRNYFPFLFRKNEKHFTEIFKFLFACLLETNERIVALQALETLTTIAKNSMISSRIEACLSDVIPTIIRLIKTSNNESFFDFFAYLAEAYELSLERFSESIINALVDRVHMEFKAISEKKLKNNIFITKILETLKILVSNDRIIGEYYTCFDKKLEELFLYFEKLDLIDFEESLIEILNEIIKKINFLIDVYEIFQRNMKAIFLKNKKDIKVLFETFTLFSLHCRDFIVFHKADLLSEMIEVTIMSFEGYTPENLLLDYLEFSQSCILLQIFALYFRDFLGSVNLIIKKSFELFITFQPLKTNPAFDPLYARVLQNLLVFAHFYPAETAPFYTKNLEIQRTLIEDSLKLSPHFLRNSIYNKKTFLFGMLAFLKKELPVNSQEVAVETNPSNNKDMIWGFKTVVEKVIHTVKDTTENRKKPGSSGFGSKERESATMKEAAIQEEDDDEFLSLKANEELSPLINYSLTANKDKIIEKTLEKLNLPIFEIDEYKLFQEYFKGLQSLYPDFYLSVINLLDASDRQELREIQSTRYVTTDQNTILPRRILKVRQDKKK